MAIKVAYLFGAGASEGELKLNGTSKSILMEDIATEIAVKIRDAADRRFDEVSNDLIAGVNIEYLITLYEASGTSLHNDIAKKLKTLFRQEIQDRINELGESFKPTLLSALIDMHEISELGEELVIVLTTNYEDLIEKAMLSVKGGVNYLIRVISSAEYLKVMENSPPILKLHGSFNWKNDDPILIQSNISDEENVIWIPPGMVKRRQYYPFDLIWGKARELLECDVLRIVGCSLSLSDWELLSLLFTTQTRRTEVYQPYIIELIDYPEKCEQIKTEYSYLRNLKTILEISEVQEFLVKTYLPQYIGQATIPFDKIDTVAKHLDNDSKINIFELWLRAKGEKLFDKGISIKTKGEYFEKFVLSGLGYGKE